MQSKPRVPDVEAWKLTQISYDSGQKVGVDGVQTSPWNLQNLISPILLEMKKLVIFHICALSQLYVKQNQSTK